MGPRLVSRGNAHGFDVIKGQKKKLQWGRGLLAAEIRRAIQSLIGSILASMGPRLVSRGNDNKPHAVCKMKFGASMGPRLVSRGNVPVVFEFSDRPIMASMGPRLVSRGN